MDLGGHVNCRSAQVYVSAPGKSKDWLEEFKRELRHDYSRHHLNSYHYTGVSS